MISADIFAEYRLLLGRLEDAYREIERSMTPAIRAQRGEHGLIVRLPTKDSHHAILMKLAAMLHFLNGALILCEAGLVLGQGALERMADEAGEDVQFLSLGIVNGMTPRHEEFLDYFWREDFTNLGDIPGSFQSRPQVPRDKIAAAIHSFSSDPSSGGRTAKVLSKSYAGFVHAASPHVMELYDEGGKCFGISAAPGYRPNEHAADLWNYMYRGGLALMFAAKAFGSARLLDQVDECLQAFQNRTGRRGD